MASSNFVFDTVSPEKRAKGFAFYNLSWGVAVFIGSVIGAFLTNALPQAGIVFTGLITSNYEIVFLVSALLRFTVMAVYMKKFKEVRKVKKAEFHVLFFQLVAVRPLSGMIVNAVGSLDLTYKHVNKHMNETYKNMNKAYKNVNEHLEKHIAKPFDENMGKTYDLTMKQLQKPYEFVRKHVNFDEFIVGNVKKNEKSKRNKAKK